MSASEKLAALEALSRGEGTSRDGSTYDWHHDGAQILRNALPQIRALVKAAENECARKERSGDKSGVAYWAAQPDHPIPGVQRRIEMSRALAALDKALAGPETFRITPGQEKTLRRAAEREDKALGEQA